MSARSYFEGLWILFWVCVWFALALTGHWWWTALLGVMLLMAIADWNDQRLLRHGAAREVVCVPYADGDQMLRAKVGWRLAPEEDRNKVIGVVWLERPAAP